VCAYEEPVGLLDLKCKVQLSVPIREKVQEISGLMYNWSAPEAEGDGNNM